ncbi:MAG: DUF2155 domain-containing protein [Devosia sp.]
MTLLLWLTLIPPVVAAPIANPVATFSGLDKITARITNFDVYINETVQFGSLQITPRVCYTRPATETQRTSVFVEVDQVNLKGATDRIFTGWMFADSPALNAVDDAVYDFWLVDCKQSSNVPPPTAINPEAPAPTPSLSAPPTTPATALPPATTADTANTPAETTRTESGSIITLMDPKPAAENAPGGQ